MEYDKRRPRCIHYSIEWKLTVNSKAVAKDIEPNLVLVPSDFWMTPLRQNLEKLLYRKQRPNKSLRTDDTNIVVSVNGRSERDLVKRFDEFNID